MNKILHYSPILILLLFYSCKLFETKDTTAPTVNLTIAGGNEISREVTIYLDIEDDSKIDYIDIIIDDTTAATVTSNFDTISFDVTPFADESEHQLYAKVADSEGNIGESEKLDVVITEFPGWRKFEYGKSNTNNWITEFDIDNNDRVWIGTNEGIYVYDISTNILIEIDPQNGDLPNSYICDIDPIEGSRVWIASDGVNSGNITEYHYDLNTIIKNVQIPPVELYNDFYIFSIAIDKNYGVWVGGYLGLRHYNHVEFDQNFTDPDYPLYRCLNLIVNNENTLFVSEEPGLYKVENNNLNQISFDQNGFGGEYMVMDSSGNIWSSGLTKYDGNSFQQIPPINSNITAHPLLSSSDGYIYSEIINYSPPNGNWQSLGVATFKDDVWTYWKDMDSPFADTTIGVDKMYISSKSIVESQNGDIWMVLDNELWRYRPSLGGYAN